MHRELYRFGSVTFAVESAEGIERSKMCEPFRVEDAAADHTICLTFSDAIPEPPRGAAQSGPVYRWQEGGARHLLQRYSVAGKTPQFTCAVTRGARTDVTFAESYRAAAEPVRLLRVGRRVRRADDGAGGAARDERARLADGLPGG